MRNENRAVFDRTSERYDIAIELPPLPDNSAPQALSPEASATERPAIARVFDWLIARMRSRRNRLALLELSDDQLKDIGVARCQADGGYARYRRADAHHLEKTCR